MRRATLRLGAVAGGLLSVGYLAGGLLLARVTGTSAHAFVWQWSLAEWANGAAFTAAGVLLAIHRRNNPVGWLALGVGLSVGRGFFDAQLQRLTVAQAPVEGVAAGVVPLHDALGWLAPPAFALLALLLLLFPTGRPASARWRALVALVAATAVVAMLAQQGVLPSSWYDPLELVWIAGVGLGVVAVVQRYHRAAALLRQQLKVLTFTVVLAVAGFFAGAVVGLAPLTNAVFLPLIPAGIVVAVLRYRLYDIDRVVSRSVSYVLLTGVLAAIYLAAVLIGSRLLAPLAAGSELAVAAATLAAAAVFTPARRRIQTAVDRRFNRARYDAEQVVTAFRLQLRDEVDLAEVGDALVAAANRTVQPQAAALWLRQHPSSRWGAGTEVGHR